MNQIRRDERIDRKRLNEAAVTQDKQTLSSAQPICSLSSRPSTHWRSDCRFSDPNTQAPPYHLCLLRCSVKCFEYQFVFFHSHTRPLHVAGVSCNSDFQSLVSVSRYFRNFSGDNLVLQHVISRDLNIQRSASAVVGEDGRARVCRPTD